MAKTVATNKKAFRDYEILESFETGIALTGGEVKSIRGHKVDLSDSFARIEGLEVFLYNMHISPYAFDSRVGIDTKRTRKLLLNRKEIGRLAGKVQQKGLTLVPLEVYFNERGFCKIKLAVARGKKLYDRREDLKKREAERQLRRINKSFRTK